MQNVKWIFDEISATSQFPWYFGSNWAALDWCLNDSDVISTSGVNLYFTSACKIFADESNRPELLEILVRTLSRACSDWCEGVNGAAQDFRVLLCGCDRVLSEYVLKNR